MFERFTEFARQAVVKANQAARDLNHAHIDTEHELLGLLADPDGVPAHVLNALGITEELVREQVVRIGGLGDTSAQSQIPFTPAAKEVLERSLLESERLGHQFVEPEHLLLALGGISAGLAPTILAGLGVSPKQVCEEVHRVLVAQADSFLVRRSEHGGMEWRGGMRALGGRPGEPVFGIVKFALRHAFQDGRAEITISDLLLGLLNDDAVVACLEELGTRVEAARAAVESDPKSTGKSLTACDGWSRVSPSDAVREILVAARTPGVSPGDSRTDVVDLLRLLDDDQSTGPVLASVGIDVGALIGAIEQRRRSVRRERGSARLGSAVFGRFAEPARRVVVVAREEAVGLGHGYVGSEHVLLGLCAEETSAVSRVLNASGLTAGDVRERIVATVGRGETAPEGQIPLTPRVKKVMELALREALSLQHDQVSAEHLLLGLMDEGEGLAMRILRACGVDPGALRAELLLLLPSTVPPRAPTPYAFAPQPVAGPERPN